MKETIKKILLIAVVAGVGVVFVWLNVQAPRVGVNPLADLLLKTCHLGLFVLFWWAVYAVGRGAERILVGRRSWPPELAVALGVVAFVVAAFALCTVRLAYGWLFKILIVGTAAAGAFFLRGDLGRAPARVRRWLEDLDVATAALVACAAVMAFPVALQAAEPPFFWDALAKYLAVPQAYASAHGFVYLPHDAYSSTPLGGTLFYLWPLLWDGLLTANASHFVVTLLALSLTYRLARVWLGQFYASLSAVLVLLTPVVFAVIGGAHVDHFTILFAVSALYLYIRGRDAVPTLRRAATVGVFIGAAVSVAYPAAAVVVAFVPLWIYDLAKRRLRFADVAVMCGAALAVVAPWLAKAYVERGNPVFPWGYGLFGAKDFTAEQARRFVAWRFETGRERGVLELLLLPYRVSVGEGYSYRGFYGAYLPFLLPLAALALIIFRRAGRLLAFAWVFFLAWALGPQQLRFLGPALPAFAVGAAGALEAADPRKYLWAGRVWRAFVVVGVLALGVTYVAEPIFDSFPGHVFLAGMDRDEFLSHRYAYYRGQEFVNRKLPADATVLMVFVNQVLYIKRHTIYDSFPEASAFVLAAEEAADAGELYDLARSWGVTHVFVYAPEEERLWPLYAPRARNVFYDFLRRYSASIYEDDASRIYELVPPNG